MRWDKDGVGAASADLLTGEGLDIDELLAVAPNGGPVYSDRQLVVMRTAKPCGLLFSGEIDATNSMAVAETLASSLTGDQALHVDVTGLTFCDIAGIRSFVDAAEGLTRGRLLLHGLPPLLRTVMTVTGWSDIPTLELCRCSIEAR